MSFEDFQHLARLYVVGALDEGELLAFEEARRNLGEEAEAFIRECRQLSAAFALSLRPQAPRRDSKEKLMELIQKSGRGERRLHV